MEKELCISQCRDSLSQLQTKLTAQAQLLKHKHTNVCHQGPNTCSRDLLNHIKKVDVVADKYSHAHKMLQALNLSDSSEWHSEFLELRPQDICCMAKAELPNAPTWERVEECQARTLLNGNAMPEGNRTVSWIWRGSLKKNYRDHVGHKEHGEGPLPNFHCVHRCWHQIEFQLKLSKAWAWKTCWEEEVALLKEEMHRIHEFLRWKSENWLQKGNQKVISSLTTCPYQLEGLHAYASHQAHIFDTLREHFTGIWSSLELPWECLTEYTHAACLNSDLMELDGDDFWFHTLTLLFSSVAPICPLTFVLSVIDMFFLAPFFHLPVFGFSWFYPTLLYVYGPWIHMSLTLLHTLGASDMKASKIWIQALILSTHRDKFHTAHCHPRRWCQSQQISSFQVTPSLSSQ